MNKKNIPDNIDDLQGKKFADLRVLYPDELQNIRDNVQTQYFKANDAVIVEGQKGEYLYFVQSGQLRVNKYHSDSIYEIAAINPGDIFGEASVLYQSTAGAEVRAIDDTVLYAVPASVIHKIFESNEKFLRATSQLAERRSAASALAVNPAFSTLPMAVREVILFNAKNINIQAGEVVMEQGQYDPMHVLLILAGELSASLTLSSGKVIALGNAVSGDEVGEISVVTDHPHTVRVVAIKPTRVLAIKNSSIMAWSYRYSDFAYALYCQAYRKLQDNRAVLASVVADEEARQLTVDHMPSLQEFKTSHEH